MSNYCPRPNQFQATNNMNQNDMMMDGNNNYPRQRMNQETFRPRYSPEHNPKPRNYQMQNGYTNPRPKSFQNQDNTYIRPKNFQSQDNSYIRPRFKNNYNDQQEEMQNDRQFKPRTFDQRQRNSQPKKFPSPVNYFYIE
jgi:hypothetical protein